jgi:hypothetical protein
MKNRVLKLFVILAFLISVGPAANAQIDLSDNLSPTLVSISLANTSLYPGQKTLLTLVIRDDKNELINLPINIQWRPPSDAPGYIASNTDRYLSDFKILEILKGQGSVQTTMTYVLTAPDWIGSFQGAALQGIMDATRNESSFWDLYKSCDKPINGIYGLGPDGRWPLAFPNIKMNCDFNFSVRAITSEEKDALKSAADKAATLNKEMNETFIALTNSLNKYKNDISQLFRDYPVYFKQNLELQTSLQRAIDYKIPAVASQSEIESMRELIGGGSGSALASDFLLAQAGITKHVALENIKAKTAKKSTITCVKGKLSKKVSAVNPKCPAGYKKVA